MKRILRPKVNTNPVANRYSGPEERIVEFSHPEAGGGLISFRVTYLDGEPMLSVHVYRFDDETVRVTVGGAVG